MLDRRHQNGDQPQSQNGPQADLAKVALPRVALGQVVATPGALQVLAKAGVEPLELLSRHARGDWGDLGREDKRANDRALEVGERLLSAYNLPGTGERVWIITEWDRSVTTLLLPSEY